METRDVRFVGFSHIWNSIRVVSRKDDSHVFQQPSRSHRTESPNHEISLESRLALIRDDYGRRVLEARHRRIREVVDFLFLDRRLDQ